MLDMLARVRAPLILLIVGVGLSGCQSWFSDDEAESATAVSEPRTAELCYREGRYHQFSRDVCIKIGGTMVVTTVDDSEPKPIASPVEKVESSALPTDDKGRVNR